MKRKDAEVLMLTVNDKMHMNALLHYMELRVSALKEALTKAHSWDEVKRFQGAIEELQRLSRLREEVNNPDKD